MSPIYVYAFLPLVLAEGAALRALHWGSWRMSMFHALLIKFASTLGLMLGLAPQIKSAGPCGLLLYGTYAAIVEGVVLLMLQARPARQTWFAALVINFISVMILSLVKLSHLAG